MRQVKRSGLTTRAPLKPIYHDPEKVGCPRTALAALAVHLPVLTQPELVLGTWIQAKRTGDGLIVMGYFSLGPEGSALMGDAYAYGWVRQFAWMEWSSIPEGERLLRDPSALAGADEDALARVITVCMREAHWGPEALDGRFREGLLTRIVHRAAELHAERVVRAIIAQSGDPRVEAGAMQLLANDAEKHKLLSLVSPWQARIDTVEDPTLRAHLQRVLDERDEGYQDLLEVLMNEDVDAG